MTEKDPTYYLNLISRSFAGQASAEDLMELADWLKADVLHQVVYDDYKKSWQSLDKARMAKSGMPQDKPLGKESEIGDIVGEVIEGEEARPMLQLMKVGLVMLIMVIPLYFIYQYFASADMVKFTATQTTLSRLLPDSTVVELDPGSTIMYPEYFGGNIRRVNLQGSASFEVPYNAEKPFVVELNGVAVQALMDSKFCIQTKSTPEAMDVTLGSGRLVLYFKNKPEKTLVLNSNEIARVYPVKQTMIIINENETIQELDEH
ncbi:MAG: FecR domain-containing protein [Bacteroidales bacterium]|nr:FecR domain-containing protein [Bacteroidales bacterium]